MSAVYANYCQVLCTEEEIALLFGTSLAHPREQDVINISLERKIILNPSAVKNIEMLLKDAIHDYETKYGLLNVEPTRHTENHDLSAYEKLFKPETPLAKDKANLIFQLLAEVNAECCGFEKSFKMSAGTLQANRFLFAVEKNDIVVDELIELCNELEMPEDYQQELTKCYHDANMIGFGLEENGGSCVYKIYLEFWDKLKDELATNLEDLSPRQLHIGFKWDSCDNAKKNLARYYCYPLLPVHGIVKKLKALYVPQKDTASLDIIEEVVSMASARIDRENDSFIYLESGEEGQPSSSFDINLYKADLLVSDVLPILNKLGVHYSIDDAECRRFIESVKGDRLGHISGGVGRDGKTFVTIYHEAELLVAEA